MPEVLSTWAVVVAGGSGERLGADRAKAYVRLGERALLAASLELFEDHEGIDGIVCVVPDGYAERTTLLAEDLGLSKLAAAVVGGSTRADSVRRGLAELPARAHFVLVHDAARPLASTGLVDRVLDRLAGGADGVVPGLPVTDTVKRVDAEGRIRETVEREGLVGVQTPQGFVLQVLRDAYARLEAEAARRATDCSSVLELAGAGRVVVVAGERDNLKVTTPGDLERARELHAGRRSP